MTKFVTVTLRFGQENMPEWVDSSWGVWGEDERQFEVVSDKVSVATFSRMWDKSEQLDRDLWGDIGHRIRAGAKQL